MHDQYQSRVQRGDYHYYEADDSPGLLRTGGDRRQIHAELSSIAYSEPCHSTAPMKSNILSQRAACAASFLLAAPLAAQYAIDWHSISAAGLSAGGDFSLHGSMADPAAAGAIS